MRWRDIRFEKPTEHDQEGYSGEVLVAYKDNTKQAVHWMDINKTDAVAWMPLSELPAFDRIPDPPEGWRFVQAGEAFDDRAKFWNCVMEHYSDTVRCKSYQENSVYIVPIDPPEPQYRPYNAAELIQTVGKLVDGVSGYRAMITGACGDSVYCQGQRVSSDQLLKNHAWTDGGKCGVKVE
jgi:hypothetical protein